jgi:hypothetical protein
MGPPHPPAAVDGNKYYYQYEGKQVEVVDHLIRHDIKLLSMR